ncbi:hypothetical protein PG984_016381 [Apiospora sp. TS-2023a]
MDAPSSPPESYRSAMSLSITAGANALLQIGVSLSDIALVIRNGRTFGNWLRVKANDQDLFEALMEEPETPLKRKGIVEPSKMESRYSKTEFIYQSGRVSTSSQPPQRADQSQDSELPRSNSSRKTSDTPDLRPFSWLMIIIVTALDICMAHDRIIEFIVELLAITLDNAEAENSLRVSLGVNIESWRSAGKVRGMAFSILRVYRSVWRNYGNSDAIPQLNASEDYEAKRFLKCLLENDTNSFTCYSVSTLAIAKAIQACGVSITVDCKRAYESQLMVAYDKDGTFPFGEAGDPRSTYQTEMISYPAGQPHSMIQAINTKQATKDEMDVSWKLGAKAASELTLVAISQLPYSAHLSEAVCYELAENSAQYSRRYPPEVLMFSNKAFACKTQSILESLRLLFEGVLDSSEKEWLETHAGLEYLLRGNTESPKSDGMESLWLRYQSLVFGFYYKLLEPLVCLDFLATKDAYFRGVWGRNSTTFLAMCTQFGHELRTEEKVSRTHVAHMLAAMYGGRPKVHNLRSSRHNLLGVLGTTSVLALHLLRPSDKPQELARFAVLDLPIVHLVPEDDGDLYASSSYSIRFGAPSPAVKEIRQSRVPGNKWSIHSSMASVFAGGVPGVVLGARCDGRLAGWFSPAAADTLFLSSAYLRNDENGQDSSDECVKGFEVLEADFQTGVIPSPARAENDFTTFGVVHSAGSAVFRYAAAGFYGGAGDEVVIANGNMSEAFGRIEMQGSGIIIC